MAEVKVKWPPCFLRDWHPGGSLAFLREARARVAPASTLYPSASPPGFVISHLVSLPVPGMGREHLVRVWSVQGRAHGRDSVTGSRWHKCSWAGRGRAEHFLMGRYQHCSDCSRPREQRAVNATLHSITERGRAGVYAFHSPAQSPYMLPPTHPTPQH